MTILKLRNKLNKLILAGHGRKHVCVEWKYTCVTDASTATATTIIPATEASLETQEASLDRETSATFLVIK